MTYLIVTQIKFWNLRQGCDFTLDNRFKYLSGKKILLFLGKMSKEDKNIVNMKYPNIKVYSINSIIFQLKRYFRQFLSLLKLNRFYSLKRPLKFGKMTERKVRNLCINEKIDVVFCEYVWITHVLDKIPKQIVKIIDTHDIQNHFCEYYRKTNSNWKIYITEKEEFEIYSKYDIVIAISTADRDYFSSKLNNVYYLPNTYESKIYYPIDKKILNIGFIGGSANFNYDAFNWFNDNVIPYLENIQFNVYGKVCEGIISNNPNVNIIGPVDNLDDVYKNNHLMINPTFLIGGIKTKNVEALSYGKVVLTTKEGARGLENFIDEMSIFVENTKEGFIKKINEFKLDLEVFNRVGPLINQKFKSVFSNDSYIHFEEEINRIKKLKDK